MKLSLFQIIVLAIFGALAISGVVIFAFVIGNSQAQTIGEVEIWGTLDSGAFIVVLRQLVEDDDRLRAVTYVKKDPETYSRELADALAAGKGPQLFVIREDDAEKEGEKVAVIPFEVFSKEQFQNTFVEAANPYLAPEGVRAIPFVVDPLVLYWNKDILASSGFAKPPSYWDEMYAAASAIAKRDDANVLQRAALAFGEYENVDHAKDIVSLLIMQAGGRIVTRNEAGNLVPALSARTADVQQPSESALRFYTEFANPVKTFYTWNRAQKSSRAAFGAGQLALYIGLASEEPLIRRTNPNLNFAVAPVPQIRTRPNARNLGHAYAFALPKTNRNPQGALTVAYTLAGAKASGLLSKALGMPSARRDVLSEKAVGNDDLFNKQAIIAYSWTDPDSKATDAIFRAMIESITSGAAKLQEAIQRADSAMGQLVRERE